MKARYRRITRFAARYLVQAWWFELFLPRCGLGGISARGRTRRPELYPQPFHRAGGAPGGVC